MIILAALHSSLNEFHNNFVQVSITKLLKASLIYQLLSYLDLSQWQAQIVPTPH